MTNYAKTISKKDYIKNDVSICLSSKLIPYDNSISKMNLKEQDSKSKWLTSSRPAWGSTFDGKNPALVQRGVLLLMNIK